MSDQINEARRTRNLAQWLRLHDVALYLDKTPLRKAHKSLPAELSCGYEVFRGAVYDECQFYRVRRRPIRWNGSLTPEMWDHVKRVAAATAEACKGRPIDEAVELIRSRVSVSADVLRGLPSRSHVWSEFGFVHDDDD
jgi:hypothetical protein